MKTTATNRRIRQLMVAIREQILIPRPEFQRELVWTNKDKRNFLDTVLKGYPFPEIYIAAGEVNPQTGEGIELLVDGQQRLTTLYQYFTGSKELILGEFILPYSQLGIEKQKEFLEYDVVVRDLGSTSIEEIKNIFERINATSYALNAMEIRNARFNGELKKTAQDISEAKFFKDHKIFSANEGRRMKDISFCLSIIITVMSTYFNREDEFESYLDTYNDEFREKDEIKQNLFEVFTFIETCNFDEHSRVWKSSDLFTLIVEIYRALFMRNLELDPKKVSRELISFYSEVDTYSKGERFNLKLVPEYSKAASHATTDRGTRIRRGEIIQRIIHESVGS